MTLTNKTILMQHAALLALSVRTLPTLASDLKVVALLRRYYQTPSAAIEGARDALRKRLPDGWLSDALPPDLAAEWAAFLAQTQDIPEIPDNLRLTVEDLPKAIKTGLGDASRQGVADLVIALGGLFADATTAE